MTEIQNMFGYRSTEVLRRILGMAVVAATMLGAEDAAADSSLWIPSPALTSCPSVKPFDGSAFVTPTLDDLHKISFVDSELKIAKRILQEFGRELLVEADHYLDALDSVLAAFPTLRNVQDAENLGIGLRMARSRLEEESSTLAVWTRLVRSVEPDSSSYRVPSKFTIQAKRESEPDLVVSQSQARVRRAVLEFCFGDDNSSASTAS